MMSKDDLLIGVLIEETSTISFAQVCSKYHLPKQVLIEMIEEGLFQDQSTDPQHINWDQKALRRIRSAARLHLDLGINLAGVALAVELLEEIDQMHQELDILRKHF